MPTENPKISAYVPQIVYDRFNEYKDERKLSMSQAVVQLVAEYFGINLVDNSTNQFTGGLLDRMEQLEKLVADLKQSYVYLSEQVSLTQSTSEPPEVKSNDKFVDSSSEPLSSLPEVKLPDHISNQSLHELSDNVEGEPVIAENENKSLDASNLVSVQKSEPLNSLPHQLEIIELKNNEITNLKDQLSSDSEVFSGIKIKQLVLAQRLKTTEGYVQNAKSRYNTEEFTKWTTKKDPDKIGWRTVKEGRNIYYCPANDLIDEQEISLQKWLSETQSSVKKQAESLKVYSSTK